MNSYNPYAAPAANGYFGHSAPPITPMSAPPFAADGSGLTPQGWGWLTDVVKAVVPIVLSQLSATPGANMAPMSAQPTFNPMSASPNLTPQGWGWLTDVVKAVVPIVLSQLSATPGANMAPMSATPSFTPMSASPDLTTQSWFTDLVKVVVPIVLSQFSATPGANMAPMSAGPALSPYGSFMFAGPNVSTPFGNFGAGGFGFNW